MKLRVEASAEPQTALPDRKTVRPPRSLPYPLTRRQTLRLTLIPVCLLVTSASPRRPYLTVVGPSSLRMQTSRPEGVALKILPPLDMGQTTNAPEPELASNPDPIPPPVPPETPEDAAAPPHPPFPEPTAPSAPLTASAPPAPTPDIPFVLPTLPDNGAVPKNLLLDIFQRNNAANRMNGSAGRSNSQSSLSFIAPIGFQPPAPTPPPSSSATYTVTPTGSK